MTRTFLSPGSIEQLREELLNDPDAIVVGGAVGLMSSAMSPTWAAKNVDLSALGLRWVSADRVGAMATLATVERHGVGGRRAISQALAATATPALRNLITIGGVLGARSPRADAAVALAVHNARVRVLHVAGGVIAWHRVLELWELGGRFVILEVDLGAVGESRFVRFSGHHPRGPALVSVATLAAEDGSARTCVGAAMPAPALVDPLDLPSEEALISDHVASRGYRHHIMRMLIAELHNELAREV
jgi:CO/xanthine dehydrogenase FAD-binding subunit